MDIEKIPIELDSASVDAAIAKVTELRDLLTEVRELLREISPSRPALNAEELATQIASLFSPSIPPLSTENDSAADERLF